MQRSRLSGRRRLARWASLGSTLLFAYATLALSPLLDGRLRFRFWLLATIAMGVVMLLASRVQRAESLYVQVRCGVACWSMLIALVLTDIGYAIYLNRFVATRGSAAGLSSTPLISAKELVVPFFKKGDLALCKPGYHCQARVFGDLCQASDLASPTIRQSVIQLRTVDVRIDRNGYRHSTDSETASMVALGDSFTIGAGIATERTWVHLLNERMDSCYNLGFWGGSPAGEVARLNAMLTDSSGLRSLRRVVWLLFDGNDLEDVERPVVVTDSSALVDGSILEGVVTSLEAVRDSSVISRAIRGELAIGRGGSQVDGITLGARLEFSDKLGYKLFHPHYVERAAQPVSYVERHPNRPSIQRAFDEMSALADRFEFSVLVVLAPSAARVHGEQFPGLPPAEPPHFLKFLSKLAGDHGFACIDLLPIMSEVGQSELLFFRDDTHWNARGHEICAEAIIEGLDPNTQ